MVLALGGVLLLASQFAPSSGVDIFRFQLLKDASLSVSLSPWIVALIILWTLIAWWFVWPRGQPWEATEINVDVARVGKIVMRPNQETAGIAHRAWAEIMTRKAGLPFDEEHDVVVEVYDSWYQLFSEIRTLVKHIPVEKLRSSEDAQQLCDYLIQVLNQVLRPHLTRYQAAFRSWYKQQTFEDPNESPQSIQRRYPQYAELIEDLKSVNASMMDFASALWEIARGRSRDNGN